MRMFSLALLLVACSVRQNGFTPLANAVREGDADSVRQLCARGADPNQPSGHNGWTPLLHAVHTNQLDNARALLDAGANADVAAPNGTTPLMMAAGYGNRPMVALLLE